MTFDLTFSELYALRDRAASLAQRTSATGAELKRVNAAAPHADDIAEDYRRGLQTAVDDFEARLAAALVDPKADIAAVLKEGGALYFVRDLMLSKAEAVVKRLYPNGDRGMRREERRTAVAAIREKIRLLADEREEIRQEFRMQMVALKDARHQAAFEKDRNTRIAIEGQERLIREDLEAMRASEAKLEQTPSWAGQA